MKFLDYDHIVGLTATDQTFTKDGIVYLSSLKDTGWLQLLINDTVIEYVYSSNSTTTNLWPLKSGQRVKIGGASFLSGVAYFVPFF